MRTTLTPCAPRKRVGESGKIPQVDVTVFVGVCLEEVGAGTAHLDRLDVGDQVEAVRQMAAIVQRMLRAAIQAYGDQNTEGRLRVLSDDDAVDAIHVQIIRSVVADAAGKPDSMAAYLDILSIAKTLKRIVARLVPT